MFNKCFTMLILESKLTVNTIEWRPTRSFSDRRWVLLKRYVHPRTRSNYKAIEGAHHRNENNNSRNPIHAIDFKH